MIKYNDEKRDQIFFHIEEASKDIDNFIKNTKSEECIDKFNIINQNYLKNLSDFILNLQKKLKSHIISKQKKINLEIKSTYSQVLKFIFKQFAQNFLDFKIHFEQKTDYYKKNIKIKIKNFEEDILNTLKEQNTNFKTLISNYKIEQNSYLKSRTDYFNFVQQINLNELINMYNFKSNDNKSILISISKNSTKRMEISRQNCQGKQIFKEN